jgi:hypothetical protein
MGNAGIRGLPRKGIKIDSSAPDPREAFRTG